MHMHIVIGTIGQHMRIGTGTIRQRFDVEQDKLHTEERQCGPGGQFLENGTVPIKIGQLDSLYNWNCVLQIFVAQKFSEML